MKKKILIFSLAYYPKHIGGAEVAIKEITNRLSPDEFEFHLVCNRYDSTLPKKEQIGNVMVHRIGLSRKGADTASLFHPLFYIVKILYVPTAVVKTIFLNRQHKFDGFWCMMLYMSYPVAILRLFGLKRPYILSLQEGDTFARVFNRWYIKIFSPILLFGIRKATIVQSISNFLADWSKQKGFTGPSVVIPNAVDTAHFSKDIPSDVIEDRKRELGKKEGDVFLVTTSRLVNKNAVDDVIEALAMLPKNIHFIVFGTGPDEQKLKSLSSKLQLDDRVQFRGQISHESMPEYLKACDIFIRPSRSEGMGNSFVEAMAVGLPVVATQEGGIKDFLFDEKRNPDKDTTGWAVDVDNPEDIVRAVSTIIYDSAKVAEVTARAKNMVINKYDWNIIAKDMETKVFDSLFL